MKKAKRGMRLGVGWYTRESYAALLEVADDRDGLPATFEEWEKNARKLFFTLRGDGIQPEQVFVSIEDLVRWCESRGVPNDGRNRSQYVAAKVQTQPEQKPLRF